MNHVNGLYPVVRLANLRDLNKVILEDGYDDLAKHKALGYVYCDDFVSFVDRNLAPGLILDVGCGSGASFALWHVTHALEANPDRFLAAKRHEHVDVRLGAAECLPWQPSSIENVLHLQGFFQVRSDWEAMIENNRVLTLGGRFIFDFPSAEQGVVFGRSYGARGYVKALEDFGFELVEMRLMPDGYYAVCLEKTADWNLDRMHKIQLVPARDDDSPVGNGRLYRANNFDPSNLLYR